MRSQALACALRRGSADHAQLVQQAALAWNAIHALTQPDNLSVFA